MTTSGLSIVQADVNIADDGWLDALPDIEAIVNEALQAAAAREGVSGVVDVLLTDDAQMQRLNRKWRNKDRPTDVLSFPGDDSVAPQGSQPHLGDLALGLGVVMTDAAALDRPPRAHVAHLLVHGFLHLLGYDHEQADDAILMEGREAEILAAFGLPDPYGDAA